LARLESSGLRDDALRQVRSAVRVSELAVTPAVFAFVFFAPEFMEVFGREYREHAPLLRIVSLSALAGPAVYVGSGLAIAFGALRSYLSVSLAYVVISVALNMALIPWFGLQGAAVATALSAAAQCGAVTIVTRRLGYLPPRTTGLSWLFGFAVLAIASFAQPGWIAAGAWWLVMTAAFYATAGVSRDEVALLAARAIGRAN
jgi:O-antigen/teichoic acid export membrane protein